MTILIEMITSTSVRGWEGNEVEYIEFEGSTLRDFIIYDLKDGPYGYTDEQIEEEGRLLEGEDFGFTCDVTDDLTSLDYQGEEECITYNVVTFSNEEIEMFRRHMD